MKQIILSEDLILPVSTATQTILVVGKRGSGKTNTCGVLAEQFFHAGVPFVVIDPVDSWFGLKSSRDGKGPGLPIYVFGGRHADVPLEATAGTLIADVLIDHHISAVLSIKHLSGRERARFVGDLAKQLFQRNNSAFHVFLEEAHEVAPQNPYKGEEEMLGHVNRIWKLGRSSGLGGSSITQRPASLNKNITTQAEILIVHRTIGPQDISAIKEWIKYHGESEEILAQLASLKTGEAFIWAPDFPEEKPLGLRRIKVNMRETFDSSATPKAGEVRHEPKKIAAVDLEAIKSKISATIERAKAEDPKELKKQIADLKRQLSARPAETKIETKIEKVEVPILKDSQIKQLEAIADRYEKESVKLGEAAVILRACVKDAFAAKHNVAVSRANYSQNIPTVKKPLPKPVTQNSPQFTTVHQNSPSSNGHLPQGEKVVLSAIAQYQEGVNRDQLSVLTGYKRSTRDAYIQRLGEKGYLSASGGQVIATQAGVNALGPDFEPLPTGLELRRYWLNRLPEGERKVLDAILGAHPDPANREWLSEATGYKRSTRDAYIQRLTARKLCESNRDGVIASTTLFEE